VLTAAALHLVVRRWTGSHLGGFIAAWTFLTTRWVLWTWLPVAPNYAGLFYLPVIISVAAAAGGGAARWLVPLIVLQGLASPYVAAAMLAPLGALAGVRVVRPATRRAGIRLVIALLLALAALLAAYAGYVRVRLRAPGVTSQTVWRQHAEYQLPIPWGLLAPDAASAVPTVVLVLIAGAVLVRAVDRRRSDGVSPQPWRHGALWTVVGVVASLTPIVQWNGAPVILPHHLLARVVPIYEIVRFPNRLALSALIGLCILAGLAFTTCAARLRTATPGAGAAAASLALALVLAGLMYGQYVTGFRFPGWFAGRHLPRSYPLWEPPARDSELVVRVLREPGGPLLELPAGALSGPISANDAPLQAQAVYRAILHGRRILNGYGGYWPAGFDERMALARRLPDPGALARLREETGVELILVRPHLFGVVERGLCRLLARAGKTAEACRREFGATERRAWLELAARGGRPDLRLIAREARVLLFTVPGS
jgi:hypothetical protein